MRRQVARPGNAAKCLGPGARCQGNPSTTGKALELVHRTDTAMGSLLSCPVSAHDHLSKSKRVHVVGLHPIFPSTAMGLSWGGYRPLVASNPLQVSLLLLLGEGGNIARRTVDQAGQLHARVLVYPRLSSPNCLCHRRWLGGIGIRTSMGREGYHGCWLLARVRTTY
jgi:hypothetical protein